MITLKDLLSITPCSLDLAEDSDLQLLDYETCTRFRYDHEDNVVRLGGSYYDDSLQSLMSLKVVQIYPDINGHLAVFVRA